jgi:branched-chain amino acid transport system substrate-binding protein
VHDDYDHNKFAFHGYLTSTAISDQVCDAAKDLLVKDLGVKSAVVISEDAAWTIPLDAEYLKCLPTTGIKVLDHIRFSPDTTDFTPLFEKIEGEHPDIMVTGVSHVGVQPTVQWASQQVPIPMYGVSSQATSSTFWKDTNGSADSVMFQSVAAPDVAVTPKTIPFTNAYVKKYGITPAYCGYTAYDEVYYIADAIRRANSPDPEKLVTALEQTNWEGTIGRIQFNGRDSQFTHAMKSGAGTVTGLIVQWQNGKQMTVWPENVANAKMAFPAFVKVAR